MSEKHRLTITLLKIFDLCIVVVAVAIAAAALWRKLRVEEALMRRQFGDAYVRYAEHVPALIPFVV